MTRKAFIVFHLKNTNSLSLDNGLVITDFNIFIHTHGQSVGSPMLYDPRIDDHPCSSSCDSSSRLISPGQIVGSGPEMVGRSARKRGNRQKRSDLNGQKQRIPSTNQSKIYVIVTPFE